MKLKLSRTLAAAFALALGALAGTAQARDNIHWSVGIHAAPGVTFGIGNSRPVLIAPAPAYLPSPVLVAPPVIVAQPVYYVQPAPVYYGPPGKHKGWHKKKHRRHHHRDRWHD